MKYRLFRSDGVEDALTGVYPCKMNAVYTVASAYPNGSNLYLLEPITKVLNTHKDIEDTEVVK